jgi:hypothetical protein
MTVAAARKLRLASGTVRHLAGTSDAELVFLAGSVPAGLGSPTSDVDVFIVGGSSQRSRPDQTKLDDVRVDVEYRPSSWIARIEELVSEFQFGMGEVHTSPEKRSLLDDAIRLDTGRVVHATDHARLLRRHVSRHRAILADYVVAYSSRFVSRVWEDVLGFYVMAEQVPLERLGTEALWASVDGVLATHGSCYRGDKWIPRRVAAAGLPELEASFNRLSGRTTRIPPMSWARECLLIVQGLTARAQLAAAQGEAAASRLGAIRSMDGRWARSPLFTTLYFSDGVILERNDRQHFRLDAAHLACWSSAEPSALRTIRRTASMLLPSASSLAISNALENLCELGAIRPSSDWAELWDSHRDPWSQPWVGRNEKSA